MSAQNKLIQLVLTSIFFKGAKSTAGRKVRNTAGLFALAGQAFQKSGGLNGNTFGQLKRQVGLLGRMVKAYARGQYKPRTRSIVLTVATLIYFVNPIDFIPDLIPMLGFADDAALLVWLFNTVSGDLDLFEEWEKTHAVEVK